MSEREGYSFHSNREEVHPLVKTGCANFQAWVMSVLGQRLGDWFIDHFEYVVYGGYFAIERARLHRLPRELFALLAAQQHHPNAEVRRADRLPALPPRRRLI